MILYGDKEFKSNNNKLYQILVIDNKEHENYMIKIFDDYIKTDNKIMGIDFEFNHVSKNKMDVALMQLNLENDSNIGHIFLLNPGELTENNYNKLINLLIQKDIMKILHGAESLDIPYIFNQLLISKENINNFCYNFYDTKYLCEYYKLDKELETPTTKISCGIYNLLVLHNIISEAKLTELENIENMMGPIWLIKINVYNLQSSLLKYALYDVIFLPELLKSFLYLDRKAEIQYYTNVISEITCLIYKYKKNIENQYIHLENIINKMNIYFILVNNKKYLLQDIWIIYYDLMFEKIKDINYFKKFFKILTKLIIYYNIYINYDIFLKHNIKLKNINFDFFFKWLMRYTNIYNFIINYNNLIKNELK